MKAFLTKLFFGNLSNQKYSNLVPAYKKQWNNVLDIWNNKKIPDFGLERIIRLFLSLSQFIFPGLLIRHISGKYGLIQRKVAVEGYVILKLLFCFSVLILNISNYRTIFIVNIYFLVDTLFYIASLIYLSNEFTEPISYRRSLTFLFINFIEIILYFSIIYSFYDLKKEDFLNTSLKSNLDAVYFSFVTSATLGFGDYFPKDETAKIIVIFQIIVSFVFAGIFLNIFASRIQKESYFTKNNNDNNLKQN